MKTRYFIRYTEDGVIVPMSLRSLPQKPTMPGGIWYEIFKPCCDDDYEEYVGLGNRKAWVKIDGKGVPRNGPYTRAMNLAGGYFIQVPYKICCMGGSIPVADEVTIDPAVENPGGTDFMSINASDFGGTSEGGIISFIRITTFPTNSSRIRVNGVIYTSGTIGTLPDIPTNAVGQPTQSIEVDPDDGVGPVVITYKVINDSGTVSDNDGTLTIPMYEVADLTPNMTITPTTMTGITNFTGIIDINEIQGVATVDPTVIFIPKDAKITLTFDPGDTTVGGTPVDNADWVFDDSNPSFHIFTHAAVIAASGTSTLGFEGVFDPLGGSGSTNITVTISSSSGDGNSSNNTDSVNITFST